MSLDRWPDRTPLWPKGPTITDASWSQWLSNLVKAVNAPVDASMLTGATLAANILASSLTSVGTLTGGATGAGFTVALSTSTITGTLADARLSSNVPLLNGTNAFTGANSFATTVLDLLVGQLKFPATQNASANANTLDDYEEGTWTPTDGSGAGLSITVGGAHYVKIGQEVSVGCFVTYPATANGLAAKLTGLPFTVSTVQSALAQGFCGSGVGQQWVVQPSTTITDVYTFAGVAITNAGLSGQALVLGGRYRAAA